MNLKRSRRKIVMLGVVACLLPALSGTTGISTAADSVLHAKPSATGSGDCLSWDNACTLRTALGVASTGDEIWVAEGIHKPATETDRTAAFHLLDGVELYGGFAGTETIRDQRDWTVHETVLSGDIGTIGDDSDNSYHVIIGSGADATAMLDGFTVSGGYADGSGSDGNGGGMYSQHGSPTLTNVTFTGNFACEYWGGGMYNYDSSPVLTKVTFSSNSAYGAGGGMYNYSSSPVLTNVTFTANSAQDGGAMVNAYSSPTLTKVIITSNSADGSAGGMLNFHSSPALTNVTFEGNSANESGGMANWYGNPTLTNVAFSGNSAYDSGGAMANWYRNPALTNVTFSGNSAADKGGAMVNGFSSPTLTNCILWGNTAFTGTQIYNYFGGIPRISHTLVQDSGGSGPGWDTSLGSDGGGNIDADPQFVDAPNADLHLHVTSPAVDTGDNSSLPADTLDLDGDSDTAEPLPIDLDGNPRLVNGIVDMGAYECQAMVNVPPVANPNGPYVGNEGSPITFDGTGSSDPDGTIVAWEWDLDGDGLFDDATGPMPSHTWQDDYSGTIGLRVTDDDGATDADATAVTVYNVAPTVGAITAPVVPRQVNAEIAATADFTDPGLLDTHAAVWDWGDVSTSPGAVTEADGFGSVDGGHTYTTPGLYAISLTVTDDDGGVGRSIFEHVVIYDPGYGFVTGGGWIWSPAGAYTADPTCEGKATFGFVSRYKKGATAPTGQTELQLHVAGLNFRSTSYDWLVIAGARAQCKGTGSINGSGDYGFMLTGIDGKVEGGGGTDRFRITIWDESSDITVYDTRLGASDSGDDATELGGGSIVIHAAGPRTEQRQPIVRAR